MGDTYREGAFAVLWAIEGIKGSVPENVPNTALQIVGSFMSGYVCIQVATVRLGLVLLLLANCIAATSLVLSFVSISENENKAQHTPGSSKTADRTSSKSAAAAVPSAHQTV